MYRENDSQASSGANAVKSLGDAVCRLGEKSGLSAFSSPRSRGEARAVLGLADEGAHILELASEVDPACVSRRTIRNSMVGSR